MLFERELINEIGYKNEHYEFYAGDADFNLRAKLAGYTVRTNPKSTSIHVISHSKATNVLKYYERNNYHNLHRYNILNNSILNLLLY